MNRPVVRYPELDLPDHPARMPYCWRCPVCDGFFYRAATSTPDSCPYCEDDDE